MRTCVRARRTAAVGIRIAQWRKPTSMISILAPLDDLRWMTIGGPSRVGCVRLLIWANMSVSDHPR